MRHPDCSVVFQSPRSCLAVIWRTCLLSLNWRKIKSRELGMWWGTWHHTMTPLWHHYDTTMTPLWHHYDTAMTPLWLLLLFRGLNPIYDCFPCQIFTIDRNSSDSSLYVIMDYQVGRVNYDYDKVVMFSPNAVIIMTYLSQLYKQHWFIARSIFIRILRCWECRIC